mgnify:FL=1|tara:strand:+ start:649 stop:882 length:234 start_codon:yes stop_codon:yes gene_type:complete
MSHFGDLIRGGKQTPEVAPPAPVDTAPASVEPDEEVNLNTMSKIELEEYGRTIGIELDRRYSKDKLIEQLYEKLAEI